MYSLIRSYRRSDWTSSPLPSTVGPSSDCRLSPATASAASPFKSMEFRYGSGSSMVVEATYLRVLLSA